VFLRMISYYITWHVHARLAPILFTDDDKTTAKPPAPPRRPRRPLSASPGQGRRQAHHW